MKQDSSTRDFSLPSGSLLLHVQIADLQSGANNVRLPGPSPLGSRKRASSSGSSKKKSKTTATDVADVVEKGRQVAGQLSKSADGEKSDVEEEVEGEEEEVEEEDEGDGGEEEADGEDGLPDGKKGGKKGGKHGIKGGQKGKKGAGENSLKNVGGNKAKAFDDIPDELAYVRSVKSRHSSKGSNAAGKANGHDNGTDDAEAKDAEVIDAKVTGVTEGGKDSGKGEGEEGEKENEGEVGVAMVEERDRVGEEEAKERWGERYKRRKAKGEGEEGEGAAPALPIAHYRRVTVDGIGYSVGDTVFVQVGEEHMETDVDVTLR